MSNLEEPRVEEEFMHEGNPVPTSGTELTDEMITAVGRELNRERGRSRRVFVGAWKHFPLEDR